MGEVSGSGIPETCKERQLSQIMTCSVISITATEIL